VFRAFSITQGMIVEAELRGLRKKKQEGIDWRGRGGIRSAAWKRWPFWALLSFCQGKDLVDRPDWISASRATRTTARMKKGRRQVVAMKRGGKGVGWGDGAVGCSV